MVQDELVEPGGQGTAGARSDRDSVERCRRLATKGGRCGGARKGAQQRRRNKGGATKEKDDEND